MVWYYAESGQQRGPISDSELDEMIANGRVSRETLVWRDGMDNWQPLETVRDVSSPVASYSAPLTAPGYSAAIQPAYAQGLEVCHNCGRQFPSQSFTRLGNVRVCPECAPGLIQQVRQIDTQRPAVAAEPGVRYGGFWIRAVAKSVDHILISLLLTPLSVRMMPQDFPDKVADLILKLMSDPEGFLKQMEPYAHQFFPYLITTLVCYNALFVAIMSATPGKYLCGIKVISADGARVNVAQAFARAVIPGLFIVADQFGLAGAGALVVGIGYFMVAFDSEKRSLFDRICRTRVVRR